MKILVVGCGSIGERHIRNLKSLAVDEIIACDTDHKRLSAIGKKYKIQTYADLGRALCQDIGAALVCTPPVTHIPIAREIIDCGTHIFIEKPLSHSLKGVEELINQARKRNLTILVGYNFRFHLGLRLVKKMLDEGRISKVLSARAEFGQYLPDWRPWQNYRQSYTAQKRLGGGIILDGSHELDYMRWLLGEVEEVFCFAGKLSDLQVDTEDTAEVLLKFRGGAIACIHLDFLRRDYSRNCELIGEAGSIMWSYPEQYVKVYSTKSKRWRIFRAGSDPNEMYVQEMRHFIRCVKGKEKPLVDGKNGKRILEIVLAAKKSAKSGKKVKV
ncbi:MAG: Gfo/Idh/MocA family protein [Candidatus Hadarchaeaceae archaeon]